MSSYEVPEPIINSPFDEPKQHWQWDATREEWTKRGNDPRPPVFILVCKNTQLANVVYGWLANNEAPTGIPPVKIEGFHNNGETNTIIVHSKVVHETDAGHAQSDQTRWMRFTLDTVGKTAWPMDTVGRPLARRSRQGVRCSIRSNSV